MLKNGRNMNNRPFTLIEMLMVMVLAGILAALALPAFQALTTSSSVGETTSLLKNALDVARSRAASSRRYVGLVIDYKAERNPGANNQQAIRLCQVKIKYDNNGNVASFEFDGWLPDSEWKVFEYGAALLCSGKDSGSNPGGTPVKSGASLPSGGNPGDLFSFSSVKDDADGADAFTGYGVVFTPYGSLFRPSTTLVFTVGEAKLNGGKFIYEDTDNDGNPANILKLKLNKFTGRTEVLD